MKKYTEAIDGLKNIFQISIRRISSQVWQFDWTNFLLVMLPLQIGYRLCFRINPLLVIKTLLNSVNCSDLIFIWFIFMMKKLISINFLFSNRKSELKIDNRLKIKKRKKAFTGDHIYKNSQYSCRYLPTLTVNLQVLGQQM